MKKNNFKAPIIAKISRPNYIKPKTKLTFAQSK